MNGVRGTVAELRLQLDVLYNPEVLQRLVVAELLDRPP